MILDEKACNGKVDRTHGNQPAGPFAVEAGEILHLLRPVALQEVDKS